MFKSIHVQYIHILSQYTLFNDMAVRLRGLIRYAIMPTQETEVETEMTVVVCKSEHLADDASGGGHFMSTSLSPSSSTSSSSSSMSSIKLSSSKDSTSLSYQKSSSTCSCSNSLVAAS